MATVSLCLSFLLPTVTEKKNLHNEVDHNNFTQTKSMIDICSGTFIVSSFYDCWK